MKILIFARKTKVIRKATPTNTIHTPEHKMKTRCNNLKKTWRTHEKRAFSENHAFLMKIHIFARKTRATGTRKTRKSIPVGWTDTPRKWVTRCLPWDDTVPKLVWGILRGWHVISGRLNECHEWMTCDQCRTRAVWLKCEYDNIYIYIYIFIYFYIFILYIHK